MGQRLLIVDGDRRFIQDHQVALEAAFDVDYLPSTEGVLPRLESGDFAAALICVEVSENKGYAICSAIRKNQALGYLKVALISAKATEEEYARHRSLKGKADLYLHKPLASSALVAALAPLVPARSVDPDNPLGDLSGADLGEEWLESLKAELDTDEKPAAPPQPPVQQPRATIPPITLAPPPPPTVSPDAGKVELLESRVHDLETKLQAQADEIVQKTHELQELRDQHMTVTRNLDAMEQQRQDADALQQRLMEAENRVRELEETEARLRTLEGVESRVQALEEDLAGARAAQGEAEDSLAALRREAEDIGSDRVRLQGLVEDLGRQISEKERELGEARQSAEETRRMEGRLAELQDRVPGLEDAERQAQERVRQLEGQVQDQDGRLADLQRRLDTQAEAELAMQEVRDDLARQTAKVEELQSQRDAKAQELSERNREVESLKVDVAGLEATLRGQRRELAEQGGRISSLARENEGLQANVSQQEARIQELAQALSEKLQILAQRDHEASEQAARIQSLESAVAEKSAALEEREKDVAQLRNTKEQLELHCDELEHEMAKVSGQHERQQLELMQAVDERDAEIGRLHTQGETLKLQVERLQAEKQSLEGSLGERTARLDALTGAIGDLENSIRRAADLTRPF